MLKNKKPETKAKQNKAKTTNKKQKQNRLFTKSILVWLTFPEGGVFLRSFKLLDDYYLLVTMVYSNLSLLRE